MLVSYNISLKKLSNETDTQFINRLIQIKDSQKLNWSEIAYIANKELNLDYSESWYRKNYKAGMFTEDMSSYITTSNNMEEIDSEEIDSEDKLDNNLRQILMKKSEVCDLVASNNAMIRRLSREETIKDIAHDFAQTMSNPKPLLNLKNIPNECSGKEGVLLISDWHYGLVCDNYWNTFNPDICKQRISTLLTKTIEAIKFHRLEKLTVLNLSDLIAGRIHTQIRIESRFDVITQTMTVAEILAEFLSELSLYCPVRFYSCLDNHSRVEPDKKESLDLESLTRIIPWYLLERLELNKRIQICYNEFGEDIITCEVLNHSIVAVHGHDDNPVNALEKLSLMTKKQFDLVCMAHRHHLFIEEQFESLVVCNGCLVGTDSHSKKIRLVSKPSQTLIIVSSDNVIDDIKRILV